MRSIKNRVLVKKVDASRWKDEMITPGGLKLFLPTASEVATHDIKYWGEVVTVPQALNGVRANDTEVRIKPGDFVYFNYKTLMREPLLEADLPGGKEPVWEVEYSDVFCKVVDGVIHAIGDWVLVTFKKDTERLGSGLLLNPFEKLVEGQGQVVAISPAAGINTEDGPVAPGDMVYFPHDQGSFENEIEGQPMWCVNASIIFASEKL